MSHDYGFTQNREISWMKFNERVLHEALDNDTPLLEKVAFLKIFQSNLDEFNMVRVGSLHDLSLVKDAGIDNKTGMTPKEQLELIFDHMHGLYAEKDRVFDIVNREMNRNGISNLSFNQLTKQQYKALDKYFVDFIEPILSPQIVDKTHPFPFLENKMEYLIVQIDADKDQFGIMPLTTALPKIVKLPSDLGIKFIRTSLIIREYAERCFQGYKLKNKAIIRVTRNADLSADDEIIDDDLDYTTHMKKILKKRKRLHPVRVETGVDTANAIVEMVCKNLGVSQKQVYFTRSPLSMDFMDEVKPLLDESFVKTHTYDPYMPQIPKSIGNIHDIDRYVRSGNDVLLSFPYDSMDPFLELLDRASEDPDAVSIKITIYRLAKNSRLVDILCKAADRGKTVTCYMELRARFDEENNMGYSQRLYDAGCNVVFGIAGYKIHSKVCQITYKGKNGWDYVTQIGTGNYNETTAKLYTDFSLITSNTEIGDDCSDFFNNLSIGNIAGEYKRILQSPTSLKQKLMKMIDEEIEKKEDGFLFFKMNSLTDRDFIDKLCEASKSGVKVKMIIRGICCLIPGIEGRTDNIEIHSIVGRFLEHPRVYVIGKEMENVYIGSADLMTRNTERRVEVLCPVLDPALRERICNYLQVQFDDKVKGRKINNLGSMESIPFDGDSEPVVAQKYFMESAMKGSASASLSNMADGKGNFNIFKKIFELFRTS